MSRKTKPAKRSKLRKRSTLQRAKDRQRIPEFLRLGNLPPDVWVGPKGLVRPNPGQPPHFEEGREDDNLRWLGVMAIAGCVLVVAAVIWLVLQ